jgi:glycosyltransferase involved in cell wall biosynthesis
LNPPKRIRLFIDAHTFDNEFQGTRTFIREIYRQVALLGPEIDFFIAARDTDNLKREFNFLPNANFIRYKSGSSMLRIFFEIPGILKKYKIDFSHFQYISPLTGTGKFIVTTHDILFNDFKSEFPLVYRASRNFLFRRSIQNAEIKTTVSDYSRQRIASHYGIRAEKIIVIPNGVSEIYFREYNKENSRKYIAQKFRIKNFLLYVSRIEPRKNNLHLLEVYLELRLFEKGISLVFIGKKSISSRGFEKLMNSLPPEAHAYVFHIEQVGDEDLLEFYRAAEVFVYPSKAEGFGIPPLEAAALKTPVLCSNATAMKDFEFFGDNLFDPVNKPELKEKLAGILNGADPKKYEVISEKIREQYSWRRGAAILLTAIKSCSTFKNRENKN